MELSPIYTTEPMATRALAAEIRQDARRFLNLLRHRSGARSFGALQRVRCEALEQVDVLLEFERDGEPYLVGIEAKFNHELGRDQISRESSALDTLFVLVPDFDAVPEWLHDEFPEVPVIGWKETLECFIAPRITIDDLAAIKVPKVAIEAQLNGLSFEGRLVGWRIETERNGNGNPSIVFESPELPDGRTLRGQIQVVGRGVPDQVEDVRLESHIGIAVSEDETSYFDPERSDSVPIWIENLKTLQREVLTGEEDRLLISRRAPGTSRRALGRWKKPLAQKHLGEHAYLAKGYTDGWAIGPKTKNVPLERLEELATVTAEIFERWYAAETS
ncbi:hypothetical protein [Leucobacter ruminantium]|uniref:Uncharacterized protein n=1 Tax=Leucobacter ruminantium TaxID=1289170 RepID=A0A939LW04_9MICO|nr:hypothetical protein [Leucobacter ruminantium]MBO1805451.1 hypothetical protein [Leucobacter ruminantium]